MNLQPFTAPFEHRINSEHLRGDEVEFIIYNIILQVLVIVCVILVARIAYLCK